MAHRNIRKKFKVEDKNFNEHSFEAIGFMGKREFSVSGFEMFRRTAQLDNYYIDKKDTIREFLDQLPTKLRPYKLVMSRSNLGEPDETIYFSYSVCDEKWFQDRVSLDSDFDDSWLVVRRCE